MHYQNILLENREGTAILTINRPEARNSLDPQTWSELKDAINCCKDDLGAKVVIITGAGGKAFASGADIKAFAKRTVLDMMNSEANDILFHLTNMPKPTIAAIEGFALGGGNELGMACDIRIAGRGAKFGQPEVKLGLIASAGGTQRLQKLVGVGKAKQLLFTGTIISAEEAERIGLVEQVVEDGTALEAALDMAETIKANGPLAVRLTKMSINLGGSVDLRSGLYVEKYLQALAFTTEDKEEGISSFIEKRPPKFKGQ